MNRASLAIFTGIMSMCLSTVSFGESNLKNTTDPAYGSTTSSSRSQREPPPKPVDPAAPAVPAKPSDKPAEAAKPAAPVKPSGTPAEAAAKSAPALEIPTVPVKGGCFKMGDTFGDGFENEKPAREICLSDYSIGIYLVTQGQWKQVMGTNPSYFKDCGDECPVENVSWNEVQEFIAKLNKLSGKEYRLPTEAEWEYACRSGGKPEKLCGGNELEALAWYSGNSGDRTHPVGMKRRNGLGIFDMNGNVWEWVGDWYEEKNSSTGKDPKGPATGERRVVRGGGWFMMPKNVRATVRSSVAPTIHNYDLGLRLAISPR